MTNSINAAIEAASKAAETAVTTQAAALPATTAAPGLPGAPAPSKLTFDQIATGQMSVDIWLKVKEFGLIIGDKPTILVQSAKVVLNMKEAVPNMTIKFGQNPPQYYKTYDGVNAAGGGLWSQKVADAQRFDPKARPYPSADLPFLVIEDIKGPKGEVLATKGQRIGYSIATTGFKEFEAFRGKLAEQGLTDGTVLVQLGFKAMSNKHGQTWGVVTYELLGAYNAA